MRGLVKRLDELERAMRRRGHASDTSAAAAMLADAGFRVYPFDGGLSVDRAPGLSAKLDEIEAAGIDPGLLIIIRNFATEAEVAADRHGAARVGPEEEGTGASYSPPARPADESERTPNPPTLRRRDDGE